MCEKQNGYQDELRGCICVSMSLPCRKRFPSYVLVCVVVLLFVVDYSLDIYLGKGFSRRRTELSFEGFDNETGTRNGCYIVPNYVHFIRLGNGRVSFPEAVCLLAAFRHQKPDKLFIHTDVALTGKYWNVVKSTQGFLDVLVLKKTLQPTQIFGQELNPRWRRFHGGDVTRIRVLMEYGGIFLDNDSYVVRSLDDFRRFELALGWKPGKTMENQVVVAHKDARFLKLWLESYRDNYVPHKWYYNAGSFPTTFLERQPYLVHREEKLFGVYGVFSKIFLSKWPEWKKYYAVHLLVRHQERLKNVSANLPYPVTFNEKNIHHYPIAFRDMAYDVYPFPQKTPRTASKNKTYH